MKFPEYVRFVQSNMKDAVSDFDMVNTLLMVFVKKYEIKGKDTFLYEMDKGNVSRVLNKGQSLPQSILEHIHDNDLLDYAKNEFKNVLLPNIRKDGVVNQTKKMLSDGTMDTSLRHLYYFLIEQNMIDTLLASMFLNSILESYCDNHNFITKERASSLRIFCVNENNELDNNLTAVPMVRLLNTPLESMFEAIVSRYDSIKGLRTFKRAFSQNDTDFNDKFGMIGEMIASYTKMMHRDIIIDADATYLINEFAAENNITIDDNFFDLGNLKEVSSGISAVTFPYQTDVTLSGSESEKRKYNEIMLLKDDIANYNKAKLFSESFREIYCLKLAIANLGNLADSDIKVSLHIPKKTFFDLNELKRINCDDLKEIDQKYHLADMLQIKKDKNYLGYYETIVDGTNKSGDILCPKMFCYSDDEFYSEIWDDIKGSYYEQTTDNEVYVEITFDKLIHNTTAAFPSVLLLKGQPEMIRCEICSKNLTDTQKINISK